MLFKLSLKNIKKSFKDYAIYFLTLILGVAIFYMFNSIDSQQAMMVVSDSTKQIIQLMINMLGVISVFVAVILGFLIIYANNFLIKRRKKEFGVYMTLGMGKKQISKILLIETILIGIISLAVGLVIGVFGSQLMSILVAKLFEADMSKYEFIFSQAACIKTCIYFAVMYLAVMVFNTFSISKYKLIDLLTAVRKNEKVKIKNPIICVLIFIVAVCMLGYAYYKVTGGVGSLDTIDKLLLPITLGVVSTFLIFWSFSGFILTVVQKSKKIYLKNANMFVLRQLNNKINTTVVSITIICLMLFMTITVLSSALSLRNILTKDLLEMTPVDVNLYKTANIDETNTKYKPERIEDSKIPIQETLTNNGFDINNLKDIIEVPTYSVNEITLGSTLGDIKEEIEKSFPFLAFDSFETIMKISDYNKIAKLYGIEQYELNQNEYIIICDFENMINVRNVGLNARTNININGEAFSPKYKECKPGYVQMSTSHTNSGIILVPDTTQFTSSQMQQRLLVANYNASTDEEKRNIENMLTDEQSEFMQNLVKNGAYIDGFTKISIIESSAGIASIVTFIAIYLGVIFLIASCAILALKELTESSDNKQRYTILRKIGADEKLINRALLKQIGIFFILPLILAIIHSIFGIKFAMSIMAVQVKPEELLPSIIATVIFLGVIYGIYFMATYLESKNIIKEEDR